MKEDKVIFRKVKGRIVPMKVKNSKPDYKGLALGAAGAGVSIIGARKVGRALSKFGWKAKLAGELATIFAGEALVAEGLDKYTESLGLKHRTEQNIKDMTGGVVGVLGALSTMPFGRKLRRFKK